jgi:hypothetical protein
LRSGQPAERQLRHIRRRSFWNRLLGVLLEVALLARLLFWRLNRPGSLTFAAALSLPLAAACYRACHNSGSQVRTCANHLRPGGHDGQRSREEFAHELGHEFDYKSALYIGQIALALLRAQAFHYQVNARFAHMHRL